MRNRLLILALLSAASVLGQEEQTKKDHGKIYGGFESNAQWYVNDKGRDLPHPEDPLRSNNYLLVNYAIGKFTAGIQAEAYEEKALLNYNPGYEGVDVGIWFADYKSDKIQLTGGYFYEQFGSGTILRAWEDRALGINTALRGGRAIWSPTDDVKLTALYGRQRSGFDVSHGDIYGFDGQWNLDKMLRLEKSDFGIGFSYVGRYEKTDIPDPAFNDLTNAFSGRFNYGYNAFYLSGEYDWKSKDAVLDPQFHIGNDFVKPGSALLLNFGWSGKNLGVDATLRRTENMLFLSEREPTPTGDGVSTSLNFNDKVIGYIPSLTKQHHGNLANIYVYQAQSKVDFIDPEILKAGETGGQIDLYYNFEKGTSLGGKYGTDVALNVSSWYNLPGSYRQVPPDYGTKFFGVGETYFTDYNIEVKKQLAENWHTAFYYITQFYNKEWLEGGDIVRTHILDAEATYNFTASRSIRVEGEHMWADADKRNWASATVEFNLNDRWSFYTWDMYNYGNENADLRTHYYNLGGAYRKNSTRIALSYGRQRGGLVCVGGVCRFVPESTGLSLSLSRAF
jgi:hypothetical protein